MNTLLSWVYPALWFSGGLIVTSVLGVVSYLFVHWLDDGFPELLVFLEICLGYSLFYLVLATMPYGLVPVGILSVISVGGTLAERAIIPTHQSWWAGSVRMMFTIACSLVLFCLAWLLIGSMGPIRISTGPEFDIGGLMGAVCSPSVFPVALWVWHSSQLRPGVEKPLKKEEKVETK